MSSTGKFALSPSAAFCASWSLGAAGAASVTRLRQGASRTSRIFLERPWMLNGF